MRTSGKSGRVLIGLTLLAIGVALLVDNFSSWHFPLGILWPIILLTVGLANLLGRGASRWLGGGLTAFGVIFLLDALDVWSFEMRDVWRLWPAVLVLAGARILFGGRRRSRRRKRRARRSSSNRSASVSASDGLDVNCFFASTEERVAGSKFSGGQVSAVFGSAVVDLRSAATTGGVPVIDVTALFGSIVLRVPTDWIVELRFTNVLGSAQDDRLDPPVDTSNRVAVTGLCMFGSIEVRS